MTSGKTILRQAGGLLALILIGALLMPGAALAVDDALIAHEGLNGFDDYVDSICAVGDVIWIHGGRGVYAYDAGTGEMTSYPFSEAWTAARQGWYDPERKDTLYRSVFAWFGWNDGVYALVRTGVRGGMVDGELCRLVVNGQGETDFETVGPIDWQTLSGDDYLQIDNCCVVNDVLCVTSWQGDQRLCFIPLDGSRATVTDVCCWQVCPFDGGVLAVDEEWDDGTEYVLYKVDVPSGAKARLARYAPAGSEISGVAQEPGGERVLLVDNGYLTALDPVSGETERIAAIPIDTQQHCGACAVILSCGAYATGGFNGVSIRQVLNRPVSENTELVVGQNFWAEPLDEAILAFDRSHPGVTVAKVDADQIIERLLTHEDDIDIFLMHSLYGSEAALGDVLGRGYALELESDALTAYVSSLYPALRDVFMRDGRPVAVPLTADAMGLSVNQAGLEALGLTIDDVPTNWPDFLAFMNSLKGNGRVPVVSSWIDLVNARHPFLDRLLEDYQLEMEAGRQTSWDSPELHAALQALADVDFEGLIEDAQALESQWEGNPLIDSYSSVGVSGITFANPLEGVPLRLSVSADSPVVLPVRCGVALVNPASRHVEEAVALLEEAIGYVDHGQLATMSPAVAEPERDEAGYQRALTDIQRQIESQQARVDAGDLNAVDELKSSKAFQAEMDDYYWIISQDSLDWYRAHDSNVMLEISGELEAINSSSITIPCAENGIDPDALIAEIEKKTQMRRMESAGRAE